MAHNQTRLPHRDRNSHSIHNTTDSEEYDGDLTWWEREDKLKEKRGRTNAAASPLPRTGTGTGTTAQTHKRTRFPTVGIAPHRENRVPTETPEGIHRRDFFASKNDPAWWERGKQGASHTASPTTSRLNLGLARSRSHSTSTHHQAPSSTPSDIERLRLTALEFLDDSKRIEEDYHRWQSTHKETLSKDLRTLKKERDAQKERKRILEAELKQLNRDLRANASHASGLTKALTNLRRDAANETLLIDDLKSTLADLQKPVKTVHHLKEGFKGDVTNPKKSYIRLMTKFKASLEGKKNLEVYNEHGSSHSDKDRLAGLQQRIQLHNEITREIEALSKGYNGRYA